MIALIKSIGLSVTGRCLPFHVLSTTERRFHREAVEYVHLTPHDDTAGCLFAAFHAELAASERKLVRCLPEVIRIQSKMFKDGWIIRKRSNEQCVYNKQNNMTTFYVVLLYSYGWKRYEV